MTDLPKKIKVSGKVYVSESIAPNKSGQKIKYKDSVYVAEASDLPAEYIMLEGVTWKRTVPVEQYMKKVMTESAAPGKALPNKIKIKGTDIVLEMVNVNVN